MKTYTIKLDSVDKVKDFVSVVSYFPFDLDLCSDRYVLDAKSIMGIFSLDISKALTLKAYSENTEELEALENGIRKFFST